MIGLGDNRITIELEELKRKGGEEGQTKKRHYGEIERNGAKREMKQYNLNQYPINKCIKIRHSGGMYVFENG